jgi:conjugal transfer/type IV secretion protein DotA/TraY
MIFGRNKNDNSSENSASKEKTLVSQALRYSHMPGIIPRFRELAGKFGHFAYMLALIYSAVNLIPKNHPFLIARNVGSYGIRDVIATAANNVKFDKQNIDKILIFGAVLMSVVLVAGQIIVIAITAATSGQANASTTSFFETPNPNSDVVFIFLTQVFGPLGIFGSGASTVATPVHAGLHDMLAFYSSAMMVLAVIIVIYYIVTIVGEAAVTGTPFGRRFNSLWAPIRLVVALGMLVPLSNGLNSAQYITLYIAKMGSGLATNGWSAFITRFSAPTNVFVQADAQNMAYVVKYVLTAEVCSKAVKQIGGNDVTPLIVGPGTPVPLQSAVVADVLRDARDAGYSHIRVAWNVGGEEPFEAHCSGFSVNVTPLTYTARDADGNPEVRTLAFSNQIQEAYLQAIKDAQASIGGGDNSLAQRIVDLYVEFDANGELANGNSELANIVSQLQTVHTSIQGAVDAAITASNSNMVAIDNNVVLADLQAGGWGKAGLWYPIIGQLNQRYSSVAGELPALDMPSTPQDGARVTGLRTIGNWLARRFGWLWGGQDEAELAHNLDLALERADWIGNRFMFTATGVNLDPDTGGLAGAGSWAFDGIVNWLFKTDALYNYQTSGSATLDPMVGLMKVGDVQISRAISAIKWLIMVKVGGPVVGLVVGTAVGGPGGSVIGAIAGMLVEQIFEAAGFILYLMIIIGLGAGLMLYYVLPLMPFIYFFFAVVAWVMEIFEAIVAMPLWALSHLKIDGDGLPGQMASNGYFLLLGVLLRPILIVFGLIGGYLVFGAGAYYMHTVYGLVVNVVRGGEGGTAPGTMGALIYTIIFVYLSYNLAVMSFKMIDNVPKSILRWIGQGGATPFSDEKPDPISGSQSLVFAAAGMAMYMRPNTSGDVAKGRELAARRNPMGRGSDSATQN